MRIIGRVLAFVLVLAAVGEAGAQAPGAERRQDGHPSPQCDSSCRSARQYAAELCAEEKRAFNLARSSCVKDADPRFLTCQVYYRCLKPGEAPPRAPAPIAAAPSATPPPAPPVAAPPAAAAPAPAVEGMWLGEYACGQELTGLTFTISQGRGGLRGVLDFYPLDENPSAETGSAEYAVEFQEADRSLAARGRRWIRQPRLGALTLPFSGRFNTALTQFEGDVDAPGCGRISFGRVN